MRFGTEPKSPVNESLTAISLLFIRLLSFRRIETQAVPRRHMVGMTGLISRYTTARVPLAVEKRGYVPSVGVLRNLRARISLKVTAQFILELRLHNKKGPNERLLVETLGP